MFDVNLLNKPGFQVSDGSLDEEQSVLKVDKNNSSNNINTNSDNSGYYYLVLIVLILFTYIYFFNTAAFKKEYEKIYPANVLSIMQINNSEHDIVNIKIEADFFTIVNNYDNSSIAYYKQAYFDSLFNTKSFLSIDELYNDLFLEFNWYILEDSSWDIESLFEKINSEQLLSLNVDFLNRKIISVADYEELILLFNILNRLGVDHIFKYEIELFRETIESKKKYYKIIISEYD